MEDIRMAELKENLKNSQEMQDWYSQCPRCLEKLKGTLAELMKHRCKDGN